MKIAFKKSLFTNNIKRSFFPSTFKLNSNTIFKQSIKRFAEGNPVKMVCTNFILS